MRRFGLLLHLNTYLELWETNDVSHKHIKTGTVYNTVSVRDGRKGCSEGEEGVHRSDGVWEL